MNDYRSVFSISPQPNLITAAPPQPPVNEPVSVNANTRDYRDDYYKLYTVVDKFLNGQCPFSELKSVKESLLA